MLLLLIKTRLLKFLCCDIWMDFGYFSNIRAIGNCIVTRLKYYDYCANFSVYVHSACFSSVSDSKYKLSQINIKFEIKNISFYAIFSNFIGMTRKDCEKFLSPKIGPVIMLNSSASNSERMDQNSILEQFTSSLIDGYIKPRCDYEICHVMLISSTSLIDSNVTNMKTEKIFGSQSIEDKESSSIYNYGTSERIRNSIHNGIILVLLRLNQKNVSVNEPKYCKLPVFVEVDSKPTIISFVFQQNPMNIKLKRSRKQQRDVVIQMEMFDLKSFEEYLSAFQFKNFLVMQMKKQRVCKM